MRGWMAPLALLGISGFVVVACGSDDAKRHAVDDGGGAAGVGVIPGGGGESGGGGGSESAGEGGVSGAGGAPTAIDVAAYCTGAVNEYFDWLAECYGTENYGPDFREEFVGRGIEHCSSAGALVESESLGFDGVSASACLAALEGESCDGFEFLTDIDVCASLFTARAELGDACFPGATRYFAITGLANAECVGSYCDVSGEVCPGECAPFKADDEPCASSSECQPESYCDETCTARIANGEVCIAGDSCERGSACVVRGDATEGICAPPSELGDACSETAPCNGYSCLDGECRSKVETGEACLLYVNCPAGERCLDRGGEGTTCGPPGDAGVPCGGPADCDRDHYCPTVGESVCTARAAVDDACTGTGQCEAGAWCNVETTTCQASGALGDACSMFGIASFDADACQSGLSCMSDGECHPVGGEGEPCNTQVAKSCEAGLFCSREDFTCQAFAAEGERCNPFWPSPCADGLGCLCGPDCVEYGGNPRVSDDLHTCGAPRGVGEDCLSDNECDDETQCYGVPRQCRVPPRECNVQ